MKTKTSMVLAAAAVAAFSGPARAQACNGFPTGPGQYSVAGVANFPSGFDEYGVEASYHFANPAAVNGGWLHDSGGGETLDHFRIGASWDLAPLNLGGGTPISVCPVASLDYASKNGASESVVPLGVGLAISVPVSADRSTLLQPYVVPAAVIDHVSGGGLSDTQTNFGLRGGATLSFGSFYVAGEVNKVFVTDSRAVFGVKVGFRAR
jgi:hypothetical protein